MPAAPAPLRRPGRPHIAPTAPAPLRMLRAALLALLTAAAVLLPAGAAHAEDTPPGPVRLVLVTSGLTWEDVDASATPHLQCLADRSGVAAMNTSSTTPLSTRAQGFESLHTGYRGLAAEAKRSAGIPDPPVDLLSRVPGGAVTVDGAAGLAGAPADAGLLVVELPSVPRGDAADRAAGLAELDAEVGRVLEAEGGCDAASLPRTLLASVGAVDVPATSAIASAPPGSAQLQVVMDSGLPGTALTSGATHQSGVVVLTDLLPTVLAGHDVPVPATLPGQPLQGQEVEHPQLLALDRTQAAGLVDRATVPALGTWVLPGVAGLVVLLVPPLARRRRLAAVARAALTIAPLCLPAGLCAALVPWWRTSHPVLALTGVVWAGSILLAVIVLAGPWRRTRLGPPGVAGALVAGIILLESATGSRLQLGSPLGAQAISGGRYYGLSNHLFGMVLAGALLALLALFSRLSSRRARVLAAVLVGLAVAGVCVAPSMGADFGSMLVTVPTFGILALAVSGIRVRVWHVLVLGVGGVAAVMAVSFLDWLRPPEQRTHLGRFIDDLLSGELVSVVVRKLAQNIDMVLGIWPLAVLMVIALVLTVAMLMPRRARLGRLAAFDAAHPEAYAVRIALAIGAWLGDAVNDTGPVLVAAVLGVTLALLIPMWPDPRAVEAR
ncbi:hypothetical protein BRM3_05390 [Brachybacterium huguangmaarense]|uniref:Uncharacterized protein n=1 Tax=Brachybacterium huguangmaarense TaxID=1652028 RepID=A0ABY6G3R9_9MICO|nr:hypothetical protein [Brachybacterium huguangmaarense]UYG17857.1 hypothetical protein BRM3_05390 [Brachybacterium huguangmaarense]